MAPLSDDRLARLGLWCVSGITRENIREREQRHGSAAAALEAITGGAALAQGALEAAEKLGAAILMPGDVGWPSAVENVAGPPGALFVWGTLPADLDSKGVAIVGSRHATAAGLAFARELAAELAGEGHPIVSGGALGIDGAAHSGALGRGPTVAILGSSLDNLYPPQHVELFRRIAGEGGAVVTEFPFGTPPWKGLFPRRNRLIAALSGAVVVVEAATRSGSLSTARHAQALGRSLFAVPGAPSQPTCAGTNALLKSGGAEVCTGAADVRRALGKLAPSGAKSLAPPLPLPSPLRDDLLERVRRLLGATPVALDEIAQAAGLSPAQVASSITQLEILGLASRAPGGVFRPTTVREIP